MSTGGPRRPFGSRRRSVFRTRTGPRSRPPPKRNARPIASRAWTSTGRSRRRPTARTCPTSPIGSGRKARNRAARPRSSLTKCSTAAAGRSAAFPFCPRRPRGAFPPARSRSTGIAWLSCRETRPCRPAGGRGEPFASRSRTGPHGTRCPPESRSIAASWSGHRRGWEAGRGIGHAPSSRPTRRTDLRAKTVQLCRKPCGRGFPRRLFCRCRCT